MKRSHATLVAASLLFVALAGCTDDDPTAGSSDFKAQVPDDPVNEPFVFEAVAEGDAYRWDLGDGTIIEGEKKVEHTYGFTDGTITVRLHVDRDGESFRFTKQFELGTGKNGNPTFSFEASTDWLVAGEELVVSGAKSTDPDDDPILYRWTCERMGDLQEPDGHAHAHGGGGGLPLGVNFLAQTVNASSLPTPDRSADGAFCDTFTAEGRGTFTRDATVAGTFPDTGVYKIHMNGKDPKSAVFVGELILFVTDDRPPESEEFPFNETATGGYGGNVQSILGETGETFDVVTHEFTTQLPNKAGSVITFDYESPVDDGSSFTAAEYKITKTGSDSAVVTQNGDEEILLAADTFLNGQDYEVHVIIQQGLQVDYELVISVDYDMDPHHLWAEPT